MLKNKQTLQIEINQVEDQLFKLKNELRQVKEDEKELEQKQLIENFILNKDHIKLLKQMKFLGMFLGDTVCIGVDGKRPFGNSYIPRDIANILNWKLPNSDLSDEQLKQANKLFKELPLALNRIIWILNETTIN